MALVPIILATSRVALSFLPQTGYLHPDEMFQSVDIVGGRYFDSKIEPAWEFKTDKPIRSMLIPYLLNSIAFRISQTIQSQPSAYLLLVIPRLLYTLLSFIVDICLFKVCGYYSSRGLWYLPVSVIFQSSFICLGCMTRTLSNTIEVIIFALLLLMICQLIRPRFRILFVTPNGRTSPAFERIKSSKQLMSSLVIGIILSLGIFNRPTFVVFALVPMCYWLAESYKRNLWDLKLTITRAIAPLGIAFILTSIALSLFDTIFYKDISVIQDLIDNLSSGRYDKFLNGILNEWVLTPLNFIRYNTSVENLSNYGLHAPYFHLLVNGPVYFNILALLFYGKLISLLIGSGMYRLIFLTHRVFALMILSSLTPIILFSFIPHQEFRFLLPIIVPLAYAFAFDIYKSNKLSTIWTIINISLVIFYAFVHQGGVLRSILHLDSMIKTTLAESSKLDYIESHPIINILAFRCYSVPTYMWNVDSDDSRVHFDTLDTFTDFESSLESKFGNILSRFNGTMGNEFVDSDLTTSMTSIYVMLPTIYLDHLGKWLSAQEGLLFDSFTMRDIRRFVPHFSGENLDISLGLLRKQGLRALKEAFGFSLLQLNITNSFV